MAQLTIFQLYDNAKVIHIQEKLCCKFWMLTFSGVVIADMILFCDAGHGSEDGAPSQLCEPKGEQPTHLQPFCTHTTIPVFTFSTGFDKLHEVFKILL